MIAHESSRPSGRKYFGLLRSETEPMRNFETPYASERPVSAEPSWAFEYCGMLAEDVGDGEREVVADQVIGGVADEDAGEDAAGGAGGMRRRSTLCSRPAAAGTGCEPDYMGLRIIAGDASYSGLDLTRPRARFSMRCGPLPELHDIGHIPFAGGAYRAEP